MPGTVPTHPAPAFFDTNQALQNTRDSIAGKGFFTLFARQNYTKLDKRANFSRRFSQKHHRNAETAAKKTNFTANYLAVSIMWRNFAHDKHVSQNKSFTT